MRVTFLGTGTSTGIPVVGCRCDVCTSEDPRNQRLRQSVKVEVRGKHFLIDTTPDLRLQLLRSPIPRLDFLLYTHSHADHLMGPDDSLALLEGVDTLALDGLRPSRTHPTHFTIEEAVEAAKRVGARLTYIIHLAHEVDHETVEATLPENIRLSWDGMVLEFPE